jgi:hypothetical protein
MKTTTATTGQVRLVRTIRPITPDGSGYFTGWGPRVPGI